MTLKNQLLHIVVVAACNVTLVHVAAAQPLVNLRPAGISRRAMDEFRAQRGRIDERTARTTTLNELIQPPAVSPRRMWYWFTIGGALVGAGAIGVLGAKHCDTGCRDDGGLGFVPFYIAGGALIGAGAGTVVGVAVDAARSGSPPPARP